MKRTIALILTLVMVLGMLPLAASASVFTDVNPEDYYAEAVNWAVEKEITNGMTPTTFGPQENCTRAHVVTFLWRAMGKPEPTITAHEFTDAEEGAFYYSAMLWAVEKGVTTGMTATTFGPYEPCTRGQVVTFLWRTMEKPEPYQTTHAFTDVVAGAYYYQPMLWAVENGITNGMSATTFVPDGTCTRGQVVTFLYRCLKDSEEPVTPTEPTTEPTTEPATEPAVEPLKIVVQPSDAVCGAGDTVSFSVTVQGGVEPYSYQWQYKDNTMSDYENIGADTRTACTGYNADTLNIEIYTTDFTKETTFRCVVTDGSQTTHSEAATVIDEELPRIKTQPQEIAVKMGETGSTMFEAESGHGLLSYEWQYKKNGMTDFVPIDGSLNGVYYTGPGLYVQMQDYLLEGNYQFRCKVTDAKGNSVQTDPICITELKPLAFTTQPQSITGAEPGDEVTFTTATTGGQISHRYQWYYRYNYQTFDTPIEGATEATYTHTLTETDRQYDVQFFCRVTDLSENSVDSEIAKVTFKLWIKPQKVNPYPVETGEDYTLMVTPAGGSGTYTYQWELYFTQNRLWKNPEDKYSWIEPASVTTSMLKINILKDHFPDVYQFRCTVSDGTDSVVSEIIKLTRK